MAQSPDRIQRLAESGGSNRDRVSSTEPEESVSENEQLPHSFFLKYVLPASIVESLDSLEKRIRRVYWTICRFTSFVLMKTMSARSRLQSESDRIAARNASAGSMALVFYMFLLAWLADLVTGYAVQNIIYGLVISASGATLAGGVDLSNARERLGVHNIDQDRDVYLSTQRSAGFILVSVGFTLQILILYLDSTNLPGWWPLFTPGDFNQMFIIVIAAAIFIVSISSIIEIAILSVMLGLSMFSTFWVVLELFGAMEAVYASGGVVLLFELIWLGKFAFPSVLNMLRSIRNTISEYQEIYS